MLKTLKSVIKWVVAIAIIVAVAIFLASINGLSVSRTVATVNGSDITEAEFKYYLENVKYEILTENNISGEDSEKEFWKSEVDGKKASDLAIERAKEMLLSTETAVKYANDAGIKLTDEEIASAHSILTTESVEEIEKATGADEKLLKVLLEKSALSNKYRTYLSEQTESPIAVESSEIEEKVSTDYAVAKHILIKNTPDELVDENGKEIDAEAYEKEAKKKADEALQKALAGDDFDALIKEYGEDPGMESSPGGYVINRAGVTVDGQSQMVPEFTNGVFAANVNGVNEKLVESTYGWHIVKRLELSKDSDDYKTALQNMSSSLTAERFNDYIKTLAKDTKASFKENVIKSIKVK